MIIDTHCHLDFPDFNQDRNEVLKRAKEAGVGAIINIGTSVETSMLSYKLAKEETDIYTSLGIHPHHADEVNGKIPEELKGLCKDKKIVAIGEVGLDYYRNLSSKKMQKALFLDSIELALQEDLPLVIHTRDAHKDMLGILKSYNSTFKGVMHCFSGDEGFLKDSIEMGFYISFTCNLTFKNANKLRTLAKKVPPERLLLETDAPFLAPQEYRGKRNEPAYLKSLVEAHSKIHGLSCDDIERITTHNAICLFGLPYKEEGKIAYPIRDSLYINITNECTNDCSFCVKRSTDFVKGHNLKLGKEPDIDEIMDAAKGYPGYKKIVFCGYGEPTLRLDLLKKAAKRFKDMGFHTRLATNGEGNLINKRPIAKELKECIDMVSVSLNVDTSQMYDKICKSRFGKGVYKEIKQFAIECRDNGIEVELSFLDLAGVDIDRCREIAENELKVGFRLRRYNVVG